MPKLRILTVPEPPKPLKNDGFTYDGYLRVHGVLRYDYEEVLELLFPERIEKDQRSHTVEDAQHICTRSWFAAQLTHYGFDFHDIETTEQLKNRLEKEILAHENVSISVPPHVGAASAALTIPERIQILENDFKRKWRRIANPYWEALENYRDEVAYSKLSPIRQAKQNPERYIKWRYLNVDGAPDRTIRPKSETLTGLSSSVCDRLHKEASEVQGLYSFGSSFRQEQFLTIGWDLKDVISKTTLWKKFRKHQYEQKHKRKIEELLARKSEDLNKQNSARQAEILVLQKNLSTAAEANPKDSSKAESYVGSYVLYLHDSTPLDRQHKPASEMTLCISTHANKNCLTGAFNFGFLEGTMLLSVAQPENRLKSPFGNTPKTTTKSASSSANASAKFTAQGSSKRPATDDLDASTAKKLKTSDGSKRSLFLRRLDMVWRGFGNNTNHNDASVNVGHIDFRVTLTGFTAMMSTSFTGDIKLSGRKISNEPRDHEFLWDEYSDSEGEVEAPLTSSCSSSGLKAEQR
ncbi:hypothetical protein BT63DRAFT_280214 [Microthyrium microscopicum]|uniref:Uncharacterized protein n=1 Tax=Microthyrium microscopicum TaxID=703497 RepID=A0A6A6U9C8_9PEZI|nr:hypothetical protein BT63DRAFT_280214 [Microthyrium microscopicum]